MRAVDQKHNYQLEWLNSVPSIRKVVKCVDHLSKAISSKVASVQSTSPVREGLTLHYKVRFSVLVRFLP